ncbi:MAG: cation:proton antiporter [Bilophila wadsworthia]
MSPIVGYLLAGIIVGPYSPGFVADADTASQCAEVGIILLMFGVGLHFHLKDLLAVQRIVLPGAAAQIGAATLLGMVVSHGFGWSYRRGVFMAISVASTVVLTRVLSDNKALHHNGPRGPRLAGGRSSPSFTALPAIVGGSEQSESVWHVLAVTITETRRSWSSLWWSASGSSPSSLPMWPAPNPGSVYPLRPCPGPAWPWALPTSAPPWPWRLPQRMVVGQSEFSSQAATGLPMRDAFAVLFVSVGMLFNPASLISDWPLIRHARNRPHRQTPGRLHCGQALRQAFAHGPFRRSALAQIGNFLILAAMGVSFGILPKEAQRSS